MATIKGIISFPTLFTPKVAKGATAAKYSCSILLPPTDPQVEVLKQAIATAKANDFPNGYNGADECFNEYDTKYRGKDYYDPKFSGWWVFSCSRKEEDGITPVVDMNRAPLIDRGKVFSGCVVYVNAGISGYTKGKGGIGGWLNGVMVTDEEPPMGRLDGSQTVDQMFGNIEVPATTAPPAAPIAPPVPPAPAAGLLMTPAANGVSYADYKQAGWSDEQMIEAGMAVKPSFA